MGRAYDRKLCLASPVLLDAVSRRRTVSREQKEIKKSKAFTSMGEIIHVQRSGLCCGGVTGLESKFDTTSRKQRKRNKDWIRIRAKSGTETGVREICKAASRSSIKIP